MKRVCYILITLLLSGCALLGPPPTVYTFSDSAYSVYTDKEVDNIIYFGSKNHYVFKISDPKIKYLIKNLNKGNLHINIASNHFIQDTVDVIPDNLVDISFAEKNESPELIDWAVKNDIYFDSHFNEYSYQVYLDVKRYKANQDVNKYVNKNNPMLGMSFETLINPNDVTLDLSPVTVMDGKPSLKGEPLLELIDYGWKNNRQYRKILYKKNVNN